MAAIATDFPSSQSHRQPSDQQKRHRHAPSPWSGGHAHPVGGTRTRRRATPTARGPARCGRGQGGRRERDARSRRQPLAREGADDLDQHRSSATFDLFVEALLGVPGFRPGTARWSMIGRCRRPSRPDARRPGHLDAHVRARRAPCAPGKLGNRAGGVDHPEPLHDARPEDAHEPASTINSGSYAAGFATIVAFHLLGWRSRLAS